MRIEATRLRTGTLSLPHILLIKASHRTSLIQGGRGHILPLLMAEISGDHLCRRSIYIHTCFLSTFVSKLQIRKDNFFRWWSGDLVAKQTFFFDL